MSRSARSLALPLVLGLAAVSVASFFAGGPALAAPETYEIDPVHSTFLFKVKHLDVGYVYGRFDVFSGRYVLDAAAPASSEVDITVETNSIDTNNAKRNQDLMGADYLNVEQFPTMTFKSTKVAMPGPDRWRVDGNLTLHGVTKPMTMDLVKTGEGEGMHHEHRTGFEGTMTIKRSEFGMTYALPAIGDEVHVTVAVEGVRK